MGRGSVCLFYRMEALGTCLKPGEGLSRDKLLKHWGPPTVRLWGWTQAGRRPDSLPVREVLQKQESLSQSRKESEFAPGSLDVFQYFVEMRFNGENWGRVGSEAWSEQTGEEELESVHREPRLAFRERFFFWGMTILKRIPGKLWENTPYFFFLFFAVVGLEPRAYTLHHSMALFCDGIFQNKISQTIFPAWLPISILLSS
jgi:hypothetical protein